MIKNGLARILISVRDLDESLAFYRDILGLPVVMDMPIPPNAPEQLWGLPTGTTGRVICLKHPEQTTVLDLIEFQPRSQTVIRDHAQIYDYGLFTIAFRAKDVDAAYAHLCDQGYEFISPPITYTPSWVPVTVKEAIVVGPNQTPIALIERLTEPKPVIDGDFGVMIDCSQFVADIDAVTAFYEGLGLTTVTDQVLPPGMVDEILHFPAGTESRMAFMTQPGSQAPVLELIQCSLPGQDLSEVAQPPNLGLFAIAFETDDLSALIQTLQDHNIKLLSGPVPLSLASDPPVQVVNVAGPHGVNVRFFQR